MRTQRADHCPRPSARTGPTTKEWSEAESGSPSLYASWGANRQTEQVSGVIQLRSAVRCGPNERITAQDPATGPTTKEWSEAESGSPSLYASWGANRQT
ncbi:hypothetical protein G5714_012142 [Onychostoma macrolepis]|uniref:Uncharacterized protein n=1 Tax=Onychostoma macrolepis TaxID=369639 RepID=A0A7J6CKC1_9TELE|nr:hypothetical protein G5714_012142 [Onychostoma macrolepis]